MTNCFLYGDYSSSVMDLLNEASLMRKKDAESRVLNTYYLCSHDPNTARDIEGTKVDVLMHKISNPWLDKFLMHGENLLDFGQMCREIENNIGIPYLCKPQYPKNNFLIPLHVVAKRLVRARKRATYELKNMRATFGDGVSEPSTTSIAQVSIYEWLFNDGKYRTQNEFIDKLFSVSLSYRRDKLFHTIRHPNNEKMHTCHDDFVIESAVAMLHCVDSIKVQNIRYELAWTCLFDGSNSIGLGQLV